jgi:predicted GIY-YIG superfamily endonuclease
MTEKIFIQDGDEIVEATGESLEYILAWRLDLERETSAMKAEQEAKEFARQSALAKLAALGLTEEEIAAL